MMKKRMHVGWLLLGLMILGGAGVQAQKLERKLARGSWRVFAVTDGNYSEAVVDSMRQNKRKFARRNADDGTFYRFQQDGTFAVQSIEDYGMGDQVGTFKLKATKATLKRKWIYPNQTGMGKRTKRGRAKERVYLVKRSNLVLEGRRETIYLFRVRGE